MAYELNDVSTNNLTCLFVFLFSCLFGLISWWQPMAISKELNWMVSWRNLYPASTSWTSGRRWVFSFFLHPQMFVNVWDDSLYIFIVNINFSSWVTEWKKLISETSRAINNSYKFRYFLVWFDSKVENLKWHSLHLETYRSKVNNLSVGSYNFLSSWNRWFSCKEFA